MNEKNKLVDAKLAFELAYKNKQEWEKEDAARQRQRLSDDINGAIAHGAFDVTFTEIIYKINEDWLTSLGYSVVYEQGTSSVKTSFLGENVYYGSKVKGKISWDSLDSVGNWKKT